MNLDEAFALYLEENRPTPSLLAILRTSWPKFAHFCHPLRLADVTAHHLRDFHQHLLWEPGPQGQLYKPNSVDQFLRRVRQVLRWAHGRGLLVEDPTQELLLPRPVQPVREILRWDELQAVLGAFDRTRPHGLRDAALFSLVAETHLGLVACLDLVLGQEEQLELESGTRQLLHDYLAHVRPLLAKDSHEHALFLGTGGRPLGRQAAFLRLQQSARAAAIPGQVLARTLQRSYRAHLERQAQSRHSPLQ